MTPDREISLETLEKHEDKLTSNHRGDAGTMSDMLVAMSQALRGQIATDFIRATDCDRLRRECHGQRRPRFGWPAAITALGLIATAAGLIIKMNPPTPCPPVTAAPSSTDPGAR